VKLPYLQTSVITISIFVVGTACEVKQHMKNCGPQPTTARLVPATMATEHVGEAIIALIAKFAIRVLPTLTPNF
jgi:hypothetical protein